MAPEITSGHPSSGGGGEPIYLRLSAMDLPADVTITQPANEFDPVTNPTGFKPINVSIPANTSKTVDLTDSISYIENYPYDQVLQKGIHIESSNNITVYYEEDEYYNPDIFALKGENALGKVFFTPFQNTFDNDLGYDPDPLSAIDIVATSDGTQVRITPSQDVAKFGGGVYPAGTPFLTPVLDKGETFSVVAAGNTGPEHLLGSKLEVISGENIAVTISDDSDAHPNGCRDLNGDQMVPAGVAGHEYIVMKGKLSSGEGAYVVPTQDGTEIFVDGTSQGTFDAGQYFVQSITNNATHIRGSKPVYVYHLTGFGCEMGGAVLPTIDGCTGSIEVSFYRSNDQDFYLNLMVRDGAQDDFYFEYEDGSTHHLDPNKFEQVPGKPNWYVLKNNEKLFTDDKTGGVPLDEVTKVYNTEDVFHLGLINGGSTTGCKYGYFSDFVENRGLAQDVATASDISPGNCQGDTIQLLATGGLTYEWTPPDYLSDNYIANPKALPPVGVHDYYVEMTRACYADTSIRVRLEVVENVDAFFQVDQSMGCAPHEVKIANQTTGADDYDWDYTYDKSVDSHNSDSIHYYTYPNTTNSDTVYQLRLVANNSSGCVDEFQRDVRVYPEINASFDQNTTIGCNPLDVSFNNTSSGNLDTYTWDFGDGASSSQTSPQHQYINNKNTDTTYNVEMVATSPYHCKDTAYENITVRSYIDAGFTVDTVAGCSPLPLSISHDSHGDVDTAFWSFTGTSGMSFSDTTYSRKASPPLTYFYDTATTQIDTVDIQLRVSNGHCYDTLTRTVYVYPEVTAEYTPGDMDGCNPLPVSFTNQSRYTGMTTNDTTGLSYDWEFGDGGASHRYEPGHLFDNINPADTVYQVQLTVTSPHGCQDSASSQITVSPYIKADFKVEETNGCSPFEVHFENTSEGGIDSVYWDFDEDGHTDSTITDNYFTRTFQNTGTVPDTLRLRQIVENEDGCQDTVHRNIIVYPHVTAAWQPLDTLACNPAEVAFRNQSEYVGTGDTTGLLYDWDFGDGSTSSLYEPDHSFAHTGDTTAVFPVSMRVSNPYGCADTLVDRVRVHPFVEADFTISTGAGCSPLEIQVNNYSSGGNYRWFWDDAHIPAADTTGFAGGFTKTYTNTHGTIDTLQLTLIADNGLGCSDTMKRRVVVYPEVTADYTPLDALGCNPFELTFDNLSAYSNTADNSGLTYHWDFGDGLSTKDFEPTHTFLHSGDTTALFLTRLQAISPYNCRDTITDTVEVHPFIQADFEVDRNSGCSPLNISITDNSTGGINQYYWFWDHDPSLTLSDADSTTTTVGFPITYINTSGSSQDKSLTLIVTNGHCYDTLQREITVHSSLNARFTQDTIRGCNPLTVQFEENNPTAGSFSWEFGDGASSNLEDPSHEFTNPAVRDTIYRVRYMASTPYGCTDTALQNITVYSKVRADFKIAQDEGCPPYDVTFDNTSTGNLNNTYQWSVDGGAVGSAPTDTSDFSYTFTNQDPTLRYYDVQLRAENPHGCASVYGDTITVYHDVDADFGMSRVEGCSPLEIDFSDQASVPANTTYSWSFGDGATSSATQPTHTFTNYDRVNDTSFTIDLEVISPYNCRHDTSKSITVYHQPRARFDIDTTASCPPLLTTMENQSIGHSSFEWRFGDGNTNTTDDVVTDYSYGGNNTNTVKNYNLELYVESNRSCVDSTSLILNVYPEVIADFTMDNPADCHPHPVALTDNSQNADHYLWDFDDGSSSSQEDPIHRFVNTSGSDTTYDVQLISSSAFQCKDTVTKPVEVYAQPNAQFTATPQLQKWPENRVFIANASNSGPWDYKWDFGDGQKYNARSPNYHDYDVWNSYTIGLEVQSTTSHCLDTISKQVQILPPRTYANFAIDDPDGCEPHEVSFTGAESPFVNQTNETYEYSWDFGDGTTGKGQFPNHVYDSAGTYYVSLKATGAGGSDVATDTIQVFKVPEVDFDVDPKLVMLPDQIMHCFNYTNYAESYHWNFGDGGTSDKKNPEHVYEELGTYDVVLTASQKYKGWDEIIHTCSDSLRKEDLVQVEGKGFIQFPDAFTPSRSGPSQGHWKPDDPTNQNNDIFHPIGEGVVEYKLEIFNKWGERLFISDDFRIGWDGYFEGELLPQDVYIYKAEGKYSNGSTFEKMGNVTLLHNFPVLDSENN
ncbi:MAG: PKD domain-containing protein [Bacteroidales bacterium]|nr:PKD domain-containing protein [Bacteroidales bacterium]